MKNQPRHEPVVITGIGMITPIGRCRESTWAAMRAGRHGMQFLHGLTGIPDGTLIGAPVNDLELDRPYQLKAIQLAKIAADEAVRDGRLDLAAVDRTRFGCAISGHMGDTGFIHSAFGEQRQQGDAPWWEQMFPSTAASAIAQRYRLGGPSVTHSVACASGVFDFLAAVRMIRDGSCDLALTGAGEAIHPLLAAGFQQLRVLATHDDPAQACRPFDADRTGFAMGEGAAVMVVERLEHALARGARIYAEVCGGKMLSDAHHLTGIDCDQSALATAISGALRQARMRPEDVGYVNAHGTATAQNDPVESRAIRQALGDAASQTCVSSTKSMIGHLLNAAGAVELAVTVMALRDGFLPPTLNLTHPDPQCDLDFLPLRGRKRRVNAALKLSVAFGGHVAAVALRRWNDPTSGYARPELVAA